MLTIVVSWMKILIGVRLSTVKSKCGDSFAAYVACLDKKGQSFENCRKTQKAFEECAFAVVCFLFIINFFLYFSLEDVMNHRMTDDSVVWVK
jgi:hypothetical protein